MTVRYNVPIGVMVPGCTITRTWEDEDGEYDGLTIVAITRRGDATDRVDLHFHNGTKRLWLIADTIGVVISPPVRKREDKNT